TLTWRTPYLAFAIAPFLAGLALIFVLPRGPERVGASASPSAVFQELRGVFSLIGPLISLAVVYQMTYAAALAFLALYLVDARGFEVPTAAFFVSVPYIGGLLGSPLGGGLSDRLGRKPVIIASMVLLGPLFLLVTLVPTEAIIPALALVGLVLSSRQPYYVGLFLDRAPIARTYKTPVPY